MRRTKADAQITQERILSAALATFTDEGFDGSSLEQICRSAGVTRGAAYWHFKNKRDLFVQTVLRILSQFDLVRQKIGANNDLDTRGKLIELMWYPTRAEQAFRFIGQTIAYIKQNPGFEELEAEIERDDMRLYWFFLTELSKMKSTGKEIPVEHTAMLFHTIFRGIYCQTSDSEPKAIARETIESFIDIVLG